MAEPAIKRMTVEEFLRWEDGTDTRYELVDGFPVPRKPRSAVHGMLLARLSAVFHEALKDSPECAAEISAAVPSLTRPNTCFIAALVIAPLPAHWGDILTRDPILIVEILSPSTNAFDRNLKVPEYRQIPSVQEILLIDSESAFAEILRRDGERWITEIVQGTAATLSLASVPLTVAMSELYEGIPLPERPGRTAAG